VISPKDKAESEEKPSKVLALHIGHVLNKITGNLRGIKSF
jgi:hypothetical protein